MKKESELLETAILDKNESSLNYFVKNVVICRKKLKVLAFSLEKAEKSKHELLVLFKKIKRITKEGIVIQSINDIVKLSQMPSIEKDFKKNKSLIGFDVFTYKKEIVGVVKDTIINEKNGKLIAFCMSGGVVDDLVEGYSIIPLIYTINRIDFKNENIIIEKGIEKPALLHQGGLKNLLGISKEKWEKLIQRIHTRSDKMNRRAMTGIVTGSFIGATIGVYAITRMSPRERKKAMKRTHRVLKSASRILGMYMF